MAGTLTVLRECLESLVDEGDVVLVDVESKESQSARGWATNTIEENQRLAHKIVIGLVLLVPQIILGKRYNNRYYFPLVLIKTI